MSTIDKVGEAVSDFLKKTLNLEEIRIIKAEKTNGNWLTLAEVYEENSFLKAIGLPTHVKDRNVYIVKLNDNLEVQSYERTSHITSEEK